MEKRKKRKKSLTDYFLLIIMLAALGVFVYAGYNLITIFTEYKAGEEEYAQMLEYVDVTDSDAENSEGDQDLLEAQLEPEAPIQVDFGNLQKVNPDIVGWIYMEAVPAISYPIVQGEDNEYYLRHTVEGQRNSAASIFMDFRNKDDYSDANTIIYGHNMKNQTMFGLLKQYKNAETCASSPYFWILTPERDYRYEIFSVREVSERDDMYALHSTNGETFKTYLENTQSDSLVPFQFAFDGNEKIITLSTCTTNARKRCVVQGFRKEVE